MGSGFKLSFVKVYPLQSLILILEHGFHRALEGPAVDLCASNPKTTWLMVKTVLNLVKSGFSTLPGFYLAPSP